MPQTVYPFCSQPWGIKRGYSALYAMESKAPRQEISSEKSRYPVYVKGRSNR